MMRYAYGDPAWCNCVRCIELCIWRAVHLSIASDCTFDRVLLRLKVLSHSCGCLVARENGPVIPGRKAHCLN